MQSTPNKSKNDRYISVYSCFEKNGWDEVPRCSLHQTRAKMFVFGLICLNKKKKRMENKTALL